MYTHVTWIYQLPVLLILESSQCLLLVQVSVSVEYVEFPGHLPDLAIASNVAVRHITWNGLLPIAAPSK